jgi:hypothetical protein
VFCACSSNCLSAPCGVSAKMPFDLQTCKLSEHTAAYAWNRHQSLMAKIPKYCHKAEDRDR